MIKYEKIQLDSFREKNASELDEIKYRSASFFSCAFPMS